MVLLQILLLLFFNILTRIASTSQHYMLSTDTEGLSETWGVTAEGTNMDGCQSLPQFSPTHHFLQGRGWQPAQWSFWASQEGSDSNGSHKTLD